jgi:hypothetical protein
VSALPLLAESKIRTAMANGDFDDLPGRGRPLPEENLTGVPPELRMGYRLLLGAGCLPPEAEARKELARLGTLMKAAGDPAERRRLAGRRADVELRYALLVERRRR